MSTNADLKQDQVQFLRSLSIALVIAYHSDVALISGGFIGVDIFFVVSGYVMSYKYHQLLLSGDISWLSFILKRAIRLLPAYISVLGVALLAFYFIAIPSDLEVAADSSFWSALFLSNVHFWKSANYFSLDTAYNPFSHLWSLSVEWQYYSLLPIGYLLLRSREHQFTRLLFLTAILSFVLAWWATIDKPVGAFYLLPTRIWEFSLGMLAHQINRNPNTFTFGVRNRLMSNPWVTTFALSLGTSAIVGSGIAFNSATPTPGPLLFVPCFGALLVILVGNGASLGFGNIFRSHINIWLSSISYSLYLWHQPILATANQFGPVNDEFFLTFALVLMSILLAHLTMRYIESPAKRLLILNSKRIGLAFGALILILGFAFFISTQRGFESRYLETLTSAQKSTYLELFGPNAPSHSPLDCVLTTEELTPEFIDQFRTCAATHGPAILVLGDSHAPNYFNMLRSIAQGRHIAMVAKPGCRVSDLRVDCPFDDVTQLINTNQEAIERVFYVQAGFYLFKDKLINQNGRILFSRSKIQDYEIDSLGALRIFNYFSKIYQPDKIVLIGPRMNVHVSRNYLFALSKQCENREGSKNFSVIEQNYMRLDNYLSEASRAHSIAYLSMIDSTTFDANTDIASCDQSLWIDGDHWSRAGEEYFGGRGIYTKLANKIQSKLSYSF